jgi:hypothetical protein
MPPLPHQVVARASYQAAAVERADDRALLDAVLDAPGPRRQRAGADRAERPPAQVKLGLDAVVRTERADLQAVQVLTRASP